MEPTIKPAVNQGIAINRLESWLDFVHWIEERHVNVPAIIYRGQANALWKVQSSLDRMESRYPTTKNYNGGVPDHFPLPPVNRRTHLRAFQEAVRGKRGVNPPMLSQDQWWALAQHHGLATPMLDWTLSPFVALFFAFEDRECAGCDGRYCEPEERAVFALSSSCIAERHSGDQPAPYPYSPEGETSYRVVMQGGVFLHMPPKTDLESYVREHFPEETSSETRHPRAILEKFVIPNAGRIECLKLLNKMNINRMTLFPDIDGAARYINAMWELGFDTSMGYLPRNPL